MTSGAKVGLEGIGESALAASKPTHTRSAAEQKRLRSALAIVVQEVCARRRKPSHSTGSCNLMETSGASRSCRTRPGRKQHGLWPMNATRKLACSDLTCTVRTLSMLPATRRDAIYAPPADRSANQSVALLRARRPCPLLPLKVRIEPEVLGPRTSSSMYGS